MAKKFEHGRGWLDLYLELGTKLRTEFGYSDWMKDAGDDAGLRALMNSGAIAGPDGKRIPGKVKDEFDDRAKDIGKTLQNGKPLFIYKRGEKYPRRVTLDANGQINVSNTPVTDEPLEKPKKPSFLKRFTNFFAHVFLGKQDPECEAWDKYVQESRIRENVRSPRRVQRRIDNDELLRKQIEIEQGAREPEKEKTEPEKVKTEPEKEKKEPEKEKKEPEKEREKDPKEREKVKTGVQKDELNVEKEKQAAGAEKVKEPENKQKEEIEKEKAPGNKKEAEKKEDPKKAEEKKAEELQKDDGDELFGSDDPDVKEAQQQGIRQELEKQQQEKQEHKKEEELIEKIQQEVEKKEEVRQEKVKEEIKKKEEDIKQEKEARKEEEVKQEAAEKEQEIEKEHEEPQVVMNIVNGEPLKEDKYRNAAVEENLPQKQELKKPEPKKAQPPQPGADEKEQQMLEKIKELNGGKEVPKEILETIEQFRQIMQKGEKKNATQQQKNDAMCARVGYESLKEAMLENGSAGQKSLMNAMKSPTFAKTWTQMAGGTKDMKWAVANPDKNLLEDPEKMKRLVQSVKDRANGKVLDPKAQQQAMQNELEKQRLKALKPTDPKLDTEQRRKNLGNVFGI